VGANRDSYYLTYDVTDVMKMSEQELKGLLSKEVHRVHPLKEATQIWQAAAKEAGLHFWKRHSLDYRTDYWECENEKYGCIFLVLCEEYLEVEAHSDPLYLRGRPSGKASDALSWSPLNQIDETTKPKLVAFFTKWKKKFT